MALDELKASEPPRLPLEDIIPLVLEHLHSDYDLLYKFSLVCHTFSRAASAILYRNVIFSPVFLPSLALGQPKLEIKYSLVNSSSLSYNVKFVRQLEISGYLHGRPLTNYIDRKLKEASPQWTELTSVSLHPSRCPSEFFAETLQVFCGFAQIRHLAVNHTCMDETTAKILVQFNNLTTIVLYDPTRALLGLIPEWLSRLSPTLKGLHFRGNCGSITPGVLRSLIHYLVSIREVSLGLSYSLEDGHVFEFLSQLPQLRSIDLKYYWQMKQPLLPPACSNLRHFTAIHAYTDTRAEAIHLCKWIRRVTSAARMESLTLVCDNILETWGANINYDSLVHHIAVRHAKTLRMLRMEHNFVGIDAVRQLCKNCLQMEELAIGIGLDTLKELPRLINSLPKLHSATIRVCNIRRQKLIRSFTDSDAHTLFMDGSQALRVLQVGGRKWKGRWTTTGPSQVRFVVESVEQRDAP